MAKVTHRPQHDSGKSRNIRVGKDFTRNISKADFPAIREAKAEALRLYEAEMGIRNRHKVARSPVSPTTILADLGPTVLVGRVSGRTGEQVSSRTQQANLWAWQSYVVDPRVRASAFLGQKRLKDISVDDVRDFQLSFGLNDWGPLSTNSRASIGDVLRIVLKKAIAGGACNPAIVSDPSIKWFRATATGGRNAGKDALPVEDLQGARRLLANAYTRERTGMFLRYVFGLYCGLRKGEVTGLYWSDLSAEVLRPDAFARRLRIERQIDATTGGYKKPKTSDSKRGNIPLPLWVGPILDQWLAFQTSARQAAGLPVDGDWHVCTNDLGEAKIDNSAWNRMRDCAGLSGWEFHDLRRLFKTYMMDADPAAFLEIEKRMGHSLKSHGLEASYNKSVAGRIDRASKAFFDLLDSDIEVAGRTAGPVVRPVPAAFAGSGVGS